MLVKDNTAEYIVSQEKTNYHETIYDGAIGIKETFEDSYGYKKPARRLHKTSQESHD